MFEGFPYTNFHELNTDWIIKIAKDFLDQYTNIQQTITDGLNDLDAKAQQLEALLDAWYTEHSQDIANQLADAIQDLDAWYTEHQGYLNDELTSNITEFRRLADAKAAETLASIPADYTELSDRVEELEASYTRFPVTYDASGNLVTDIAYGYQMAANNGTLYANSSYNATENYIPITAGEPLAIMHCRHYCIYDINKTFVSSNTQAHPDGVVVMPDSDGYIRFAASTVYPLMAVYSDTIPTHYVPAVKEILPEFINSNQEIERIMDIVGNPSATLHVTIENNHILITNKNFGEGVLVQECTYGTRNNGLFEFDNTKYIVNDNIISRKDEIDDITPVRVQGLGTIGGNHGYAGAFTLPANGQTLADVGSVWTDGVSTYLLTKFEEGVCTFIMDYTETDGMVSANPFAAPVSALQHVSGGAHFDQIPINPLTQVTLYPIVNRYSLEFFADGLPVTSGNYSADTFAVKEKYSIISYKGIWEYLTAHNGSLLSNNNIPQLMDVVIGYNFEGNGICNVSTTIFTREKLKLNQCGFVQAIILDTPENGHVIRRINNVGQISGNDWQTGVDMNDWNTNLTIRRENLLSPNIPCNMVIDWAMDSANNPVMGFMIGYFPDITDGKNSERIANTSQLLNIRETKKIYPYAVYGPTLDAHQQYAVSAYRIYVPPEKYVAAICNKFANGCYIVFNMYRSGRFFIDTPADYDGCAITAIETQGDVAIRSKCVTGGILIDTYGAGSAILKLTK